MEITPLLGLVGSGACVYGLGGAIRTACIEAFSIRQRIITSSWMESHAKMMEVMSTADATLENLSDFIIEAAEPFVD